MYRSVCCCFSLRDTKVTIRETFTLPLTLVLRRPPVVHRCAQTASAHGASAPFTPHRWRTAVSRAAVCRPPPTHRTGFKLQTKGGQAFLNRSEKETMSYDDVEIEDMEWNDELQAYTYPCPCGDLFQITKEDLKLGEEIARCPSCSLYITVIYNLEDFLSDSDQSRQNKGLESSKQQPLTVA